MRIKEIIIFPFTVLYKIYDLVYFVSTLILFYPLFMYFLKKEERFPIGFKIVRVFVKQWLFFTGVVPKPYNAEEMSRELNRILAE